MRATIAMEAIRLWILRIHLLRQLGYESADETVAVRHRDGAIFSIANVGGALPATASGLPSP